MVIDPNNQNNQPNPNQPQTTGVGMGQPAPKGSGRFTNLQKYVTANQGAGQQIGQRIGSQVTNQADQVRQGIQQAKTGFQGQVDTENQRIGQVQNLTQEAVANTNQFVNDPTKLGQFQQLRDAQTAQIDPLQLQEQQAKANNAMQMAQNANTEQGRFQLLKGAFANPRYTQGVGRLDQLFLQSSPALQQLQQGSKAVTQGLNPELEQTRQYSQEQIAARDSAAKAAQQNIMNTIGREDDPSTPDVDESAGEFGNFSKDIFGRINTQQQNLDAQYNDILNRFNVANKGPDGVLQKGTPDVGTRKAANLSEFFQNLTAEQQKLVGLDKDSFGYNMTPDEFKGYLRQKQLGNQERARFFNEDEYNRYQNLGKLMGTNTQQNLTKEEKALFGQGIGDYSLAALPQLQQEQQAKEAALWSGGYLNDMRDVIEGYQRAQTSGGNEIKNEVQLNPINEYLASFGIGPAMSADDNSVGETVGKALMSYNGQQAGQINFDPTTPEGGAKIQNILDHVKGLRDTATKQWRDSQIIDRARAAGMDTTLGGKKLTGAELYQRYQSFMNKGLI